MNLPFNSWQADEAKATDGVLVLVPGYNGKGEQMLDTRWKAFATVIRLRSATPRQVDAPLHGMGSAVARNSSMRLKAEI